MRDPKRIGHVLDTIRRIWEKNPDLRLGQMIDNLFGVDDIDAVLFYIEDGELEKRLWEMYKPSIPFQDYGEM
jgi:uncharacterized protein YihD (DUF1040 family)